MAAPTRSCCGRPHSGAVCPDGLVMCCICFERVTKHSLASDGFSLIDMCRSCWAKERAS
jgi:hypothetical protein